MDVGPTTLGDNFPAILGVLGSIAGGVGWLLKLGGKISSNDAAIEDLGKSALKTDDCIREVSKKLDHLRADYDTKFAAVSGRFELISGQSSDYRETAAKSFVTQAQLTQVETRTNSHIDRLVDRLEHISTRLDDISHSLVEAVSKMAPRQ